MLHTDTLDVTDVAHWLGLWAAAKVRKALCVSLAYSYNFYDQLQHQPGSSTKKCLGSRACSLQAQALRPLLAT